MTIAKLRIIDLAVFSLLTIIIDFVLGRYGLFGLRMYLSVSVCMGLMMIIRWRKWGILTVIVIVIGHMITFWNNNLLVLIAHSLSLLGIILAIIIEPKIRNKTNHFELIIFLYSGIYLVVVLLEWMFLFLFGQEIALINHLFNHSVNFMLGLFILFLISLQKELLLDMNTYLIEKSKERKNEKSN